MFFMDVKVINIFRFSMKNKKNVVLEKRFDFTNKIVLKFI